MPVIEEVPGLPASMGVAPMPADVTPSPEGGVRTIVRQTLHQGRERRRPHCTPQYQGVSMRASPADVRRPS